MLVLSRHRDGRIVIGNSENLDDNIIVTVVEIRGDKVRLGIDAPREVPVHREEIWVAIYGSQDGNQTATSMGMALPEVQQEASESGDASGTVSGGPGGNSGDGAARQA